MFRFVYNILFHLVYVLMLPKFLLRMRKRGGYRADFCERFFRLSEEKAERLSEGRKIWIHAVSVGEFGVANAFMQEWRKTRPEDGFVVTVNTSTGHALAEKALTENDVLLYPPLDSPWIVKKALDTIGPRALVLVETEMWPNLLWECESRGIPVMLLNGRISDRSYSRLEKLGVYTRRIFPLVDRFCMQSEADAERAKRLGAPVERVRVLHSVKYDGLTRDLQAEQARQDRLLRTGFLQENTRMILGSSTWPGEELMLVEAFAELQESFQELALILVPRHAERRAEVLSGLQNTGLTVACWSDASEEKLGKADVLIVDTTGELKHFTGIADRVVIGKSFYRKEGQNPLEAADAGKWILTGNGMDNFKQVMKDLRGSNAVMQVQEAEEVASALHCSLDDEEAAKEQGLRARDVVESHQGGLMGSVEELEEVLSHAETQRRGVGGVV